MIIRCSSFVRQCKLCTCLTVYFLRPYARIQPNLVQSLFYVKGNHFKWTRSQFELLIITPPHFFMFRILYEGIFNGEPKFECIANLLLKLNFLLSNYAFPLSKFAARLKSWS